MESGSFWVNVVLALITAVYVWLTYNILKQSRKSYDEQVRPYVVTDVIVVNQTIILRVRSIGQRAAYDVKINFEPPLTDAILKQGRKHELNLDPILSQPFLSPGYELSFILNYGPNFLVNHDPSKDYQYIANINYKDHKGICYREENFINLKNLIYSDKIAIFDKTHYLGLIHKEIESLRKELQIVSGYLESISNNLRKGKK